jgi:hypothetical protein
VSGRNSAQLSGNSSKSLLTIKSIDQRRAAPAAADLDAPPLPAVPPCRRACCDMARMAWIWMAWIWMARMVA